jgi:hypothetical protein
MTKEFLLHKEKKMETAHTQNCTFASPETQADASACKRAVFLPTLTEDLGYLQIGSNIKET